jgi:hypothetical protein
MNDKQETKENDLSELGRRLAAARRTVEGVCPVCGTKFTGPANKKFDKHSCAVIASRRKRNAERRKDAE